MMEEENRTSLGDEWGSFFFTFFVLLYNIQSGGCSLSVSCFKSEAVTSMYCTCGS